jgi:hypothetical protein
MAQILERIPAVREEIAEEHLQCVCGCGFAIVNDYGKTEGAPCDHCGKPLRLVTLTHISRRQAIVVVRCDCGARVECEGYDSQCSRCGQDYNAYGQRLRYGV